MSFAITGYHGTSSDSVANILLENFRKSENDDEWLGFGVYFFIEGITDPIANAIEWARNQAYDKGVYLYDDLSVLESNIVCNRDAVLNVTETEGLKVFNALRETLIQKNRKIFNSHNRNNRHDNKVLWNAISEYLDLDAIIHNLYIKDCYQRRKRVDSNVPNTTVICVKAPHLIRLESICEIVKEGVKK
tara:strand:- start:123579 stop:124145 length:567 start_codon:yes stop_codon:yes gene_type:complete